MNIHSIDWWRAALYKREIFTRRNSLAHVHFRFGVALDFALIRESVPVVAWEIVAPLSCIVALSCSDTARHFAEPSQAHAMLAIAMI